MALFSCSVVRSLLASPAFSAVGFAVGFYMSFLVELKEFFLNVWPGDLLKTILYIYILKPLGFSARLFDILIVAKLRE